MIPIKLNLKNFMCYRDATLNLEGVHLACLNGDNGAGKSALLDAVTWAMWGKGRGPDDELIAQNEVEMSVDLEFNMGEHTYKCSRRRSKRGAGKTELAFAIFNGNSWTNISEDSLRNTQQKINQIVGMKYETFINSAFLMQGRADEFTVKKPAERKEVLGEILGLAYYDELEKKAKDTAKEIEVERRDLDRRIEQIEALLKQRLAFEAERDEAQAELSNHSLKLAEHESQRARLEKTSNELGIKEKNLDELAKRLHTIQENLITLDKHSEEVESEIKRCQLVIGRQTEIEQGYTTFMVARRADEEMSAKAAIYSDLMQQQLKLQGLIDKQQTLLQSRRIALSETQKQQEELAYNVKSIMRELENAQKESDKAGQADQAIKQYETDLVKHRIDFGALQTESKRLTEEIKKLEAKIEQLPPVGSPCERCGTLMSEEARKQTLHQYLAEENEFQQRQVELKTNMDEIKTLGNKLNARINDLEPLAKGQLSWKGKVGTLEEKLKNAQQAENKVAELQLQLDEITVQLETKSYAQAEQQKLAQLIQEIVELDYNNASHKALQKQRSEFSRYETEKNRLDGALQLLPNFQRTLKANVERRLQYQAEQAENRELKKQLQSEVDGLSEIRRELARITQEVKTARDLEREANARLTRAKTKLEDCEAAEQERGRLKGRLDQALLEKGLYDELAAAFGKKGIQALVIDSVLPEIEDETNQLLSEMTSGRMSVRFDTQRDTKKGDSTIETLDLKISDELGMRPYELFSGGEAFRVNFAVRIALSKLLARRNGAQLRTLFIDEGFGTQDDKGRERLIEAIHSIENKFERILVITHLAELKDAFPVRIEVEKTPFGSKVSVN